MNSKLNAMPVIAKRIMERCDRLRQFSALNDAYFRTYLTPEHRLAAETISGWMKKAGMSCRMDAAGNMVGRYEGESANMPAVVLGSHFDTVRDAGKYDGALGITTAIECVTTLFEKHRRLPFAVEVYAFADEEGARFPVPFIGSRAVTGQLQTTDLDKKDVDGITLTHALKKFQLDHGQLYKAKRSSNEIKAYIELHIEQGPRLETEGISVAAVNGIQGQTFGKCIFLGRAGHAGTVPMSKRQDALTGAAEAILSIEKLTREADGVVATVGSITVEPGSANVISGRVSFSIDLRAYSDPLRDRVFRKICNSTNVTARRRHLEVEIIKTMDQPAVSCDPFLTSIITKACDEVTGRPLVVTSGAGHDAEIMSTICPMGMIFVRCQGGISHHPDEAVTLTDIEAGYQALVKTLEKLSTSKVKTG